MFFGNLAIACLTWSERCLKLYFLNLSGEKSKSSSSSISSASPSSYISFNSVWPASIRVGTKALGISIMLIPSAPKD